MSITKVRGMFTGQEVFVAGRGPSLDGFPWSEISGRATIAHNDSADRFATIIWFVTDNIVFHRCPFACRNSGLIVAGSRCRGTAIGLGLKQKSIFVDTVPFDKPLPAGEWMHTQWTGVTGCLYLAWHGRARRVYILGLDGWAYADQYYFDKKQHHPNRELERDVHHWIDKRRFVAKVHVDRHIPAVRACAQWLANHAEEHTMEIINLSEDSQHDAFPKKNWKKHFSV